MKFILIVTILSLSPALFAGSGKSKSKTEQISTNEKASVVAHVEGMVCEFCARGLQKVFGAENEVSKINVSLEDGIVEIYFKDKQSLSEEKIKELITGNGLKVVSIKK